MGDPLGIVLEVSSLDMSLDYLGLVREAPTSTGQGVELDLLIVTRGLIEDEIISVDPKLDLLSLGFGQNLPEDLDQPLD